MISSEELERRKAICRECPDLRAKAGGAIVFCDRDCHRPADGKYCEPYAVRQYQKMMSDETTNTTCDKWSSHMSSQSWIESVPQHKPSVDDEPMTTLFVNHFTHSDTQRRKELDECLQRNCDNPQIDRVVVLAQTDNEHRRQFDSPKLQWIDLPISGKPFYEHFFSAINRLTTTPRDINIVANGDIFFDDTLALAKSIDLEGACLALSRYEWRDGKAAEMAGSNSQDTWLFQGRVRPLGWANWPIGIWKCDWAIAWELYHCDYYVVNPCRSIRTYHLHDSPVRNTDRCTARGPYASSVYQSTLEECHFANDAPPKYGLIAYSLYGSSARYTTGAVENAKLAKVLFPGWTVRFYVDESVPKSLLGELHHLKTEVVVMPRASGHAGKFWRLLAADDAGFQRWIVRDVDSRLNLRDRRAVDHWISSGLPFHIVRDHPYHRRPILCCAFGGARAAWPIMGKSIAEWQKTGHDGYACDEDFLEEIVWPKIKDAALVHDAFGEGCEIPGGGEFGRFVGERVYEDCHYGHEDRMVFLGAYRSKMS